MLFHVIIKLYKNYFITIIIFFIKIILIFSCSGMFRNTPACSVFQILSTPVKN